ncbi:unnamed protein product [Oppiella nova]|uniref:Uncharacterized protein n=1 Tax=Oppiella nova TaxID=334625 RepID=A0A7R9M3Y3_9ACAR|nr:unnamed protein product [Oppiella nova]CAG2170298.1 unnamed protein product [Oppiella nova]
MIMPAISSGPNGEMKPDCSHAMSATKTECAGCGSFIMDRYYLSAVDRQWHVQCLKCSQCKIALDSELTCFSRDGHIYCKEDYYRIFAMKRCSRCGQGIYASELVMRVRDNIYHMQCFTCAWCNTTLAQGDYFGLKDNLVYCRTHYEMLTCGHFLLTSENAIHPSAHDRNGSSQPIMPAYGSIYSGAPTTAGGGAVTAVTGVRKGRPRKRKATDGTPIHDTHSPGVATTPSAQSPTLANSIDSNVVSNLSSSLDTGCMSDGQSSMNGSSLVLSGHASGQRTKRMRTSFKHHQLRTMKSYFSINQNPDAKDLKQLSQKTGLSKRVLQVWFQNARAKWRRNNLKLPDGQDISLGGSQSLLAHPSTPSTGIDSPNGSTRPFSSPSPTLSVNDNHSHTGSSIEFNQSSHPESIIPLATFQELF